VHCRTFHRGKKNDENLEQAQRETTNLDEKIAAEIEEFWKQLVHLINHL